MSGAFDLTLRTHAPVVTWGAVSGNVPGGSFSVAFSLDEPAITAARLIDFDAVVYPLTIGAGTLTVSLPDTVALGQATVEADVLDDVDNATTRTLTLAIQATIIPPVAPTQVVSGLPRETPPLRPVTKRSRSVVRLRSTSRVLVEAVQETAIRPVVKSTARASARSGSSIHVSCMNHARAHVEVTTAITLSTSEAVSRDESQVALLALLLS